jgi:DNA-binding SARP family transcriptional activator
MSALASSGRSVEALAAYRDARIRLANELGIEPSEALQALHRAILAGRSTARSDWLEVG